MSDNPDPNDRDLHGGDKPDRTPEWPAPYALLVPPSWPGSAAAYRAKVERGEARSIILQQR